MLSICFNTDKVSYSSILSSRNALWKECTSFSTFATRKVTRVFCILVFNLERIDIRVNRN